MSEERPPLRIVISDPKAGDKVVKVKVKGADDIEYTDEMRKTKEKERTKLPIARISKELYEELGLNEVGIMTLRFKSEGKKTNVPFKVEVSNKLNGNEVEVSMELLGEVAGNLEAEAEAFRAKAWQIAVPEDVAIRLAGLEINDVFDGTLIGYEGLKFKIRGGSDATGIPMHPGVPGAGKRRILLSGPPGFHPIEKGERRKTALAQLNVAIVYESERKGSHEER